MSKNSAYPAVGPVAPARTNQQYSLIIAHKTGVVTNPLTLLCHPQRLRLAPGHLKNRVELQGFEPWTPALQRQCSSQLSYSPSSLVRKVGLGGLEPPTSRLSGVRSNHLSYKPQLLGRLHLTSYALAAGYLHCSAFHFAA